MQITCPACATSYNVPDNAIPAAGRKVKCKNCAHNWHQNPFVPITSETTEPASASPAATTSPDSNSEKAKFNPVPRKTIAWAAGLLLGAIIIQNYHSYKGALGFSETDGLVFDEVAVKIGLEDNKLVADITGEIKNQSKDTAYELPEKAFVKVLSGQKNIMAETEYELPKQVLEPGKSVEFNPRIANISGNAKHLVVDIGNGMERFYRD